MKFWAQFVHCSDQRRDVFGLCELRNAVTEIEHVAGAASIGFEHFLGLAPHYLRRGEQHQRIEIALQGGSVADPPPRFAESRAPVQTDAVASGCGDSLQPGCAAFGENYDRNTRISHAAV